jgi:hypothetical protein
MKECCSIGRGGPGLAGHKGITRWLRSGYKKHNQVATKWDQRGAARGGSCEVVTPSATAVSPSIGLLALVSLIVASLACSSCRSTSDPYTSELLTSTASVSQEISETKSTGVSTGHPEANAGLKAELYFAFALEGAGLSPCKDELPPPGVELPRIEAGHRHSRSGDMGGLCLFGFPVGEEVTVHLYAPNGNHVGSETYTVWHEVDSIGVVAIDLWLPAGLPTGQWYAVAESTSTRAEGPFEVEPYVGPALDATPNTDISPLVSNFLSSYSAGDTVVVWGTNFEPNAQVPLGVYYCTRFWELEPPATPEVKWADTQGILVHSEMVTTDSGGNFSTLIRIESSTPTGDYVAVTGVTTPDHGVYGLYDQQIAIYNVR